jgi:uncharacterized protein YndB with AHSA1/START domain
MKNKIDMQTDKLQIKTKLQILKPVNEVFEAIVDPAKMTNYFISDSTGRMEEGKELTWRFPEFDMDIPVRIGRIEKDRYISFYWDIDVEEMIVEITLEPNGKDATIVSVTEKEKENNQAGIKSLKENTEGWANFLACLKAYVEHGINLRKGAFDFMAESKK